MPDPSAGTSVDVAVVGAGLSGLTAATALRRAGRSVIVLEARDRVGGKVWSPLVAGVPADLGAHWVGRRHHRVRGLAAELGLAIEPQYLTGRHVMEVGGRRQFPRGETPLRPLAGTLETALRLAQLEWQLRKIDPAAPWTHPRAAELDRTSIADWMRRLRTDSARAFFTVGLRTTSGKDPDELSMLAFLGFARASGGLTSMLRFRGGAQEAHLPAGAQSLATGLAAPLEDAIALSAPVRRIVQDGSSVEVEHDGGRVRAGAVIVAHSPATADAIAFDPALPADRAALQRSSPLGGYTKAILAYSTPWWRAQGRSGLAIADRGDVEMVVDVGHAADGGPGLLAAFVTGAHARPFAELDPAEQRARVIAAVVHLLGPQAREPDEFHLLAWAEERWSLGAPIGVPAPGILSTHGAALRRPEGRIHWSGTETATACPGYMEGAIIAGEEAASAVLRSGQL